MRRLLGAVVPRPALAATQRARQSLMTTTPRGQCDSATTTDPHQRNWSRAAPLNPGFFSPPGNCLIQFHGVNLGTQEWGPPYLLQEAKPRRRAPSPYFPLATNTKQPSSSCSVELVDGRRCRETTAPRMHGILTAQLATSAY